MATSFYAAKIGTERQYSVMSQKIRLKKSGILLSFSRSEGCSGKEDIASYIPAKTAVLYDCQTSLNPALPKRGIGADLASSRTILERT
jgi:hypothetical protein